MSRYNLKVENICKSFVEKPVIKKFSAEFNNTKKYGICGKNGSGKTTLLKIIAGLIRQDSGLINHNQKGLELNACYVDNNPRGFFMRLNGLDNLHFFGALNGFSRSETEAFIKLHFKIFKMESFILKALNTISLGQTQLLNIAKSYLMEPQIVLYDEVFSSLDEDNKELFIDFINSYHSKTDSIHIFTSHDRHLINEITDEVFML